MFISNVEFVSKLRKWKSRYEISQSLKRTTVILGEWGRRGEWGQKSGKFFEVTQVADSKNFGYTKT